MKAMHRCLVLVGLLACGITGAAAQWTVLNAFSSQEIQSHAVDLSLDAVAASLLTHDVEMRRLSYTMPFLGEQAAVSGAVFVPQAPGTSFPVLVYHHGTTFQRLAAPSFKTDLTNLGYAMASMGFLVLMPDYLGLGESPLQHPYCHAQSEADAGWSMLETASALVWDLDVTLNGNLYVTGYSQGGHGAMAMARATPPSALDETLSLKAAAPLSGPYDMAGTQLPWILESPDYSQPAYIFYLLQGWNSVYGTLFESFGLLPPTLRHLAGRFAGWRTFAIHQRHLSGRLDGDVAAWGDGDHGRRGLALEAAAANDVHAWVPSVPLHMRYCTEDEEVLSANATSAYEAMVALGAQDVEAYNLGAFNHNDCALSAIATSVLWFLSMESTTDVEQTGSLEPCVAWETLDVGSPLSRGRTLGRCAIQALPGNRTGGENPQAPMMGSWLLRGCWLVASMAPCFAVAQTTVVTVLDVDSLPLAQAMVQTAEAVVGFTDDQGQLVWDCEGVTSLRVVADGFETASLDPFECTGRPFEVVLQPLERALETAVVEESRESTGARPAEVMDAKRIESVPSSTGIPDLLGTLKTSASVGSNVEGQKGIVSRGGNYDQASILVDGYLLMNATHLFGMLSMFPTGSVSDVRLFVNDKPIDQSFSLGTVVQVGLNESFAPEVKHSGQVLSSVIASEALLQRVSERLFLQFSARRSNLEAIQGLIDQTINTSESREISAVYGFDDVSAKGSVLLGRHKVESVFWSATMTSTTTSTLTQA